MPSPAGWGSLAFLVSHKLLCSCCWAAAHGGVGSKHPTPARVPPEVPPLGGTWDHFKASAGLGKLKSITEQLMKQLMSLTRETEGSTEEKKTQPHKRKSQQLCLSLHQDSGFFHCSSHPEGCAPSSHALSTSNTHANTAAIVCP